MSGFIYFAQAKHDGAIKIGWTARDPRYRLAKIQTDCPYPITMIAAIKGTVVQERQIHLLLARWRKHGEWFEPHHVVIAAINEAVACGCPIPALPAPVTIPLEYVRKHVFRLSQASFATIAGTTQGSVSRWESEQLHPGFDELCRIRSAAVERSIAWNDSWFFEAPPVLARCR